MLNRFPNLCGIIWHLLTGREAIPWRQAVCMMALQGVQARSPDRFSLVYGKVLASSNRVPMVEPKSRIRNRLRHTCVSTVDIAMYACIGILRRALQVWKSCSPSGLCGCIQASAEHEQLSDALRQSGWSLCFGASSSRPGFNEALRTERTNDGSPFVCR
jgi:hypothetical protein